MARILDGRICRARSVRIQLARLLLKAYLIRRSEVGLRVEPAGGVLPVLTANAACKQKSNWITDAHGLGFF
jgi:hypothetical protein